MTSNRASIVAALVLLLLGGCARSYRISITGIGSSSRDWRDPLCGRQNPCVEVDPRALEVLEPACFFEEPGQPPSPVDCQEDAVVVRGGRGALRVRARCQEDLVRDLGARRARRWSANHHVQIAPRLDLDRYVVGGAPLLSPSAARPFDASEVDEMEVPPNTQVEVLRRWPDAAGECSLAMVRVVDAGGHTAEGRWGYARLSDLSAAPDASLPTPTEALAEAERRRREEIEARLRAVADEEVARGRCDPRSHGVLEQVLHRTTQLFEGMRDPLVRHVGHEYVVATDEGASVSFTSTLSGTYHLFVVSLGAVEFGGHDRTGNPLSMRSEYERFVSTGAGGPNVSSLRLITNDLERSVLTVRGHGCALVMGFDFIE